jgi:hypothetical protein
MAERRPLVNVSGKIKELPAGDTLPGASGSDPSYSPGTYTVSTETSKTVGARIKLTGTQKITIEGTGRLIIL